MGTAAFEDSDRVGVLDHDEFDALDLRRDEAGVLLKDRFVRGFEYSDCWVDDARLVVLNALDAAERGAESDASAIETD